MGSVNRREFIRNTLGACIGAAAPAQQAQGKTIIIKAVDPAAARKWIESIDWAVFSKPISIHKKLRDRLNGDT